MAATLLRLRPAERAEGEVNIDLRMSAVRQSWGGAARPCVSLVGDLVGAEGAWRDVAVLAELWQEVLRSARARHAERTLFRPKTPS